MSVERNHDGLGGGIVYLPIASNTNWHKEVPWITSTLTRLAKEGGWENRSPCFFRAL